MEKNKLTLRESGLYSTKDDFYRTFKNRGIKYVEDLYNEELITQLVISSRKAGSEILGFIELIRFKYDNKNLSCGRELIKPAIDESYYDQETLFGSVNFPRMGFNRNDIWLLGIIFKRLYYFSLITKNTKLIEAFKQIVDQNLLESKNNQVLNNKLSLIIKYYRKLQLLSNGNPSYIINKTK